MDRKNIDKKYKWDLDTLYKDEKSFERDIKKAKSLLEELKTFKGKVLNDSKTLYDTLKFDTSIERILEKLYIYVYLNYTLNTADNYWSSKLDSLMDLFSSISSETSFILVELSKLDDKILDKYLSENAALKVYEFYLRKIIKQKEHILSEENEQLLSTLSPVLYSGDSIFEKLDNADVEYSKILDKDGNERDLTSGTYRECMGSSDRILRKNAMEAMHKYYEKHANTIAECLKNNIKTNCIISKMRKYTSPLEQALSSDNLPPEFYSKLIENIHSHMSTLHRMMDVYKKGLKVDEMHIYDINARIGDVPTKKYSIEEIQSIIKSSLEIMGEDYIKVVEKTFNENWIDYYETDKKMSGAFSLGGFDTKPYILLNYTGGFDDIETLAHELGHSIHSYYSSQNRPIEDYQYPIFLAEIASTTHEVLLNHYLLSNTSDKEMKKYILNNILTTYKSTVFRQLEFAEFEKIIHERTQSGENLTSEDFTNIYLDLQKHYYGNVVIDDIIKYECLRIPHFYSSFYVYKYATGLCIAYKFATDIINKKENAVENYIKFISSGGKAYPLDILKECDIDLETTDVMKNSIELINQYLDEFEKLIEEE